MVYNWLKNIHAWLLPDICALCGCPAHTTLPLCSDCHNDLIFIENSCRQCALPLAGPGPDGLCGQCLRKPPAFDTALSLFPYQAPISLLIQGLKFHNRLAHARLLGGLLAAAVRERNLAVPDCLLPVPLSNRRLRQRGFNQSMELARPLAHSLQIPVATKLLRRVRDTTPQVTLTYRQRRSNIRAAFALSCDSAPGHIAIIDDIITTGSTCDEIARVLKNAGAQRVDVWSIARAYR